MSVPLTSWSTRLLRVPLRRPWGTDVRDLGIVVVEVVDEDGVVGHGFSWTPTIGARAVQALLEEHIMPFVHDARDSDPERVWDAAWAYVHEAGGGGITTIALAGADLALWDLRCRRRGLAVTDVLGRRHERLPSYGSGVNLHYPLDELVDQAKRWVRAGYRAVKVKVGRPDPEEDLERLRAVRSVIGPDRGLMIDANQRWSLSEAIERIRLLAPLRLEWVEEPLRADDLAAHRELRAAITDVPVAVGENLHTIHRFRDVLDAGVADVLQPNVVRVGGITPFLRIAELVRSRGALLAPHLLPELSAQLAFSLPDATWVEDVEEAGFWQLGALTAPSGIRIADGWARGGPEAGLGLVFRTTTAQPGGIR